MRNPQIGETVKYLRTGGLFQVKKVTKDIVILNSQDRSTQLMTPTGSLDLVFERIAPAESFRKDFNPRYKSPHSAQRSPKLKALIPRYAR